MYSVMRGCFCGQVEERRSTECDSFGRDQGGRRAGDWSVDSSDRGCGRRRRGLPFTYFKSKDELLNVLYREIKLDIANAMMSGFPRRLSVRYRLQHVWNGYVDWGVLNPAQNRVLRQI
jgi:hypothetical protein